MIMGHKTAYLVGGGPSLTDFDFKRLAGKGLVVGINKSIFDVPCDVGVSIDQRFMIGFARELDEFSTEHVLVLCPPRKVMEVCKSAVPKAIYLDESKEFVWDKHLIHRQGGTSGYAALDYVCSMGAEQVVLLGYDYKPADGKTHYHGGYDWADNANNWAQWSQNFGPLAAVVKARGIEIINGSPDSRIVSFTRFPLEMALEYFKCPA